MTAIEPTTEAVLKLPTEAKKGLLAALARELLPHGGLYLAGNGYVLYRPVPNGKALAEQDYREAPPEYLDELQRRAASPHEWVNVEEMVRMVEEDASRHSPPPSESSVEPTAARAG